MRDQNELECYNDYLYSSDRHLFLDYHNEARLRVASGVEPNGYDEMLPPAANMYKLRWSCVLENEMQERLSKCATEIPPLKGFGQNVMTIYDHKGTLLAPLKEIRETLRDWWGELELNEVSGSTISYTTEDLHNFANMVFADNTEIGCSYASCDDDEFVLIGSQYSFSLVQGRDLSQGKDYDEVVQYENTEQKTPHSRIGIVEVIEAKTSPELYDTAISRWSPFHVA
ncbi:SCP-like protein [Ancylostoma ceylanicum]|uniref:SCP-like protein n=1 Tax=Ancylostoma ceylanicum TaxID=53326 RepID=A0A0D6LUC9_9BILA|nr:SCP-like protein [Ancylostoma ceylanicum]